MSQQKSSDVSKIAELGNRIKQIRERIGLTQEQLAQQLGVHKMTLSRYETGSAHPGAEVLLELCRIDERVSPDWLLTGDGPMLRAGPWDVLKGIDWEHSDARNPQSVPREEHDAVVRELTAAIGENRRLREFSALFAQLSPAQQALFLKMLRAGVAEPTPPPASAVNEKKPGEP